MTDPIAVGCAPGTPVPRRPAAWSVLAWLLGGALALIGALVVIVVIRPLGWRLLATLLLWLAGIAALLLFSDGMDQSWTGPRRQWASQALHWVSASFVALALVVALGAIVPSLLSVPVSPSLLAALGCDLLIGVLAGVATVLLTTLSGWAGGWLSYRIRRWRGDPEEQAGRFRLGLRDEWSRRQAIRIIVLPVAGVLLSALAEQLLAGVPASTTKAAADTVPQDASLWGSVILPLIVWIGATGLVWLAFDKVGIAIDHSHPRRRRATHASALAVGLAILLGWLSASTLDSLIKDSLSGGHHQLSGVSIQSVPSGQRPAYLAREFVPQFELAPGERWEPTTVDRYVSSSRLTSATPFCTTKTPCRELICTSASCGHCDDPDPDSCAPAGGQPHAVYYRYLTAPSTGTDQPAQPGHDWAVIQYWIFYDYDSLQTDVVTQWHQADWEQVSVLVDRTGLKVYPVEVGFSEHCYGADVPAAEVTWASGTHPLSYVARGSHANYPTPNDLPIRELQCLTRQTPRYLGAAGLFFNPRVAGWSLELPIAYFTGLRDATGRALTVSDAQPISQAATSAVASFGGYWGLDNNLQVLAGRVPTGAGPQSPQEQNPAKKPFHDMFCSSKWLRVDPGAIAAWVCSASVR